jgi:hypothetical protein
VTIDGILLAVLVELEFFGLHIPQEKIAFRVFLVIFVEAGRSAWRSSDVYLIPL